MLVVYANEANRITHSAGDSHKLDTRLKLSNQQYGLQGRRHIETTGFPKT